MKNIFLVDVDETILDFHGASALALRFAFEENGIAWEEEVRFEALTQGFGKRSSAKKLRGRSSYGKDFRAFSSAWVWKRWTAMP